jgi:hypothetical protein
MEMLLDMVNQNIQEAPKNIQDNKNKDKEKTQRNSKMAARGRKQKATLL